jgi:UDP-N-acetylglucosamine--N-acetylmuramyl-(pentapeptide) pyrophosphoryl-undecaprenol N-acetylglucosamine transferase
MKVAITGGHVTPALAVIEELQKDRKNKILYFGRKYSFEGDNTLANDYQIVAKINRITYVNLATGRLQRKLTRHTISSLFKIPRGFFQAMSELRRNRPDVILSFGGYLAVPVVLAGWLLKIPVITHEQTVVVGLSNRIISFFAKKIVSLPRPAPSSTI